MTMVLWKKTKIKTTNIESMGVLKNFFPTFNPPKMNAFLLYSLKMHIKTPKINGNHQSMDVPNRNNTRIIF